MPSIASMTGFGRASSEMGLRQVDVELKSVNHRFLKLHAKLPTALSGQEARLEALVRKGISRGVVTLSIRYRDAGAGGGHRIIPQTVHSYLKTTTELHRDTGAELPSHSQMILRLIGLPGTIESEETSDLDAEAETLVQKAVEDAMEALRASRVQEGNHLRSVLLEHERISSELVDQARARAARIPSEQRDRLILRVQKLLGEVAGGGEVSEADLLREICILSDRLDVTEEIKRLEGHLALLVETLKAGGPVGRRLDFLVQEMHREANTLGTKANDSELNHIAVDLKVEIERMREQVQNLE